MRHSSIYVQLCQVCRAPSVGLWACGVAAAASRFSERPCSTLASPCFLGSCFLCLYRGDHVGARHRLSFVRSLVYFLAEAWFRYGLTEGVSTRVIALCEPRSALGTTIRSSHVAADAILSCLGESPSPR